MAMRPWATTSAYVKPEQAALMSNAPQRRPSSAATVADVAGTVRSGVVVARIDGVDRRRVEAGHAERQAAGLGRQPGRRAADVALADAGALDDPLVVRVEAHVGEVLVGELLRRQGGAPAGDDGAVGTWSDGGHGRDPLQLVRSQAMG